MDVSQYLDLFIDETREHIQSLNDNILLLEQEPENMDTINEIFRAAHSLKGMSGTMGYVRMQKLTHDLENVFSEVRSGNMKVSSKLIDIMFRALDAIEAYLQTIVDTSTEGTEDNQDIIDDLNKVLKEGTAQDKEEETQEQATLTAAASSGTGGYEDIPIDEFLRGAIEDAKEDNMTVFGLTVTLDDNCMLKGARAFLVLRALEGVGELMKAVPDVDSIENEEFENSFSLLVVTDQPMEAVKGVVENVSEIKNVRIGQVTADAVKQAKKEEPKPAPAAVKEAPQAQETGSGNNAADNNASAKETETAKDASKDNKAGHKEGGKSQGTRSIRVDIEKLDNLMNMVSELVIAKNGLSTVVGRLKTGSRQINERIEYLENITTNLHEAVMKVRMVPIDSVVSRFPRMIRDLSRKLDKKMELVMTGEDTELDRTVIDELGDPLMHILRNSADHGIESAQVRAELGKPEVGTISLNAYQAGNNVIIEVSDDGGGVNVEKVKSKALSKGLITQEHADTMSDDEAVGLLFMPGFSTADKISDVSGRGVGLDVVKSKIESLGGTVECKSALHKGSTFIITLPLTLAIMQSLLVDIGGEKYAMPLSNIQTIEEIPVDMVKSINSSEVIELRGRVIPLFRLAEILECEKGEESEVLTVIVANKGEKLGAFVVDGLYEQQEIVIKSLGKYVDAGKLIIGATILGDGEVSLILDATVLI